MKKQVTIFIGGLIMGTGIFTQAQAEALCTGKGGPGTSITVATDGTTFVRQTMTIKCSNNVYLDASQDSAKAWVAAASSKGKFYWGGNSDGGGVSRIGDDSNTVTPGSTPSTADQLDKAKVMGTST